MADQVRSDALRQLEADIIDKKQVLFERYRSETYETVRDYTLMRSDGSRVQLSELFGDHDDLILVYNMGTTCSYCTMWADGFNGLLDYLESRAAFVVCSPDPPEVQRAFASKRGWSFPMVSCDDSSFFSEMGFESSMSDRADISTFYRDRDSTIKRVASREFFPFDDYNPVWNMFGLLKDGLDGWRP